MNEIWFPDTSAVTMRNWFVHHWAFNWMVGGMAEVVGRWSGNFWLEVEPC